MVELRGFEPLTPCMPCKCSANLSYSPLGNHQITSALGRRRSHSGVGGDRLLPDDLGSITP